MGPQLGRNPGTEFAKRRKIKLRRGAKRYLRWYENTFMMYLPRLCEHCLNPLVRPLAQGCDLQAEEDGIVLIDQDKCRGWRMCISRLPLQGRFTTTGKQANRRSASSTPVSKRVCPPCARKPASGRIRYLAGVLLQRRGQNPRSGQHPQRA